MHDSVRLRIMSMILMAVLLGSIGMAVIVSGEDDSNGPIGPMDALIEGTVRNGTKDIHVEISTWDNTTEPPVKRYFNRSTVASGFFSKSVDSDPDHLTPYEIRIFRTYYRDVVREFYNFDVPINSSETQTVPSGELEVTPASIGDLRLTILNRSSGEPLEGVRVDIDQGGDFPSIPFPTANGTDVNGQVLYHSIRSINTTVSGSVEHFRTLTSSNDKDWVIVDEGGITDATFYLTEDPWPFTTIPSDGSTDVDVSRNITIDFDDVMDISTTEDTENYRITRVDTSEDVAFSASSHSLDSKADLDPLNDLAYNTTYRIRLDTGLSDDLGGHPLWRAMEFEFTTELRPGRVMGRIVDGISGEGISNVHMSIRDIDIQSNGSGHFLFDGVIAGDHSLQIDESYLYHGFLIDEIMIVKGSDVDLGDITLDRLAWGSLNVTVTSGSGPVPGAWVAIKDSQFNLTTDESGLVRFETTRTGKVTVMAGAQHHDQILDQAFVEEGVTGFLDIGLLEDPLPVIVTPTANITDSIVEQTTFFNITMPEEINRGTLDVSLWTLDDEGIRDTEIPILPITVGENLTYTVKTVSVLPMERSFVLVINGTLTNTIGELILWRDLTYEFMTPVLPLSYIVGLALLEEKPLEGLMVEFGDFEAVANSTGGFNITVDLSSTMMASALKIFGSDLGYEDYARNLTLDAGVIYDAGEISLDPLPGWYEVIPADGSSGVSPGTNVTFTFIHPISEPEEGFTNYLSLKPLGSNAPINGDYEMIAGNRTVVFQPSIQLKEGGIYSVVISSDLRFSTGGLACPVGKETQFIVRLPTVVVTLIEPASSDLDDLGIDLRIVLSFGLDVDRSSVEVSTGIAPAAVSKMFTWTSDSEVRIDLFLNADTDYTLTVPPGSYGKKGEMLNSAFILNFATGSHYSFDHTEKSFSINPDPEGGYRPDQEVRLNGLIENSTGYDVSLTIEGTGKTLTYNSTVSQDGSWEIIFKSPNMTGEITMTLSIGIPGEISAISEKSWTVELTDVGGDGGDDNPSQALIIVIVIVVIIVILVVLIALFVTRRNRDALDRSESIDYSDIDMDMEE